jgi:SAM-dependent methyltransferase
MKHDPIATIRDDYDRIAEEYARRLFHELDGKPFDREILHRFADAVSGRGDVCDLGCGPGHIARCLHDAGAQVFGLDLSPCLLDHARRLNPDISFREGNMLSLDLESGSLAGIAAFYSIVNLPGELLPTAFAEMERVLTPGGLLLLAFHIGDEVIRPAELWGHAITMEFFHLQPDAIERLLTDAGFAIEAVIERDPYAPEVEYQSRRAYIFARKPDAPAE